MRQSGDYRDNDPLTADKLRYLLQQAVEHFLVKPSNGSFQFNMRLIVDDKRKNAALQI